MTAKTQTSSTQIPKDYVVYTCFFGGVVIGSLIGFIPTLLLVISVKLAKACYRLYKDKVELKNEQASNTDSALPV